VLKKRIYLTRRVPSRGSTPFFQSLLDEYRIGRAKEAGGFDGLPLDVDARLKEGDVPFLECPVTLMRPGQARRAPFDYRVWRVIV